MPALVATVVLLAVVCAGHTALLVAVVRRLRVQAELLADVEERGLPARALPVGSTIGAFSVTDTDGEPFSAGDASGPTLVAMLSPTCGSCRRLRREFGAVAARWPGGRSRVVVVVTGPSATAAYARRLAPLARIVVDPDEVVRDAFAVTAFPALFVVEPTGELSWTGRWAHSVPQSAAATVAA
ncbi:Thiol-disulfide isomerase or thioredoxin [Micromonospora pallida]|uniref:Thiol-disulfide isomerase or thioredoxin n=1 Tax=Micromonospora pallida TaxID=145854 RepID=A0A1C6S790_9ACTN|nr:redoxin domain-containing protein [Micromonospora pallida]SCL25313.1 Thiol-disulfide isomerase or thioredoxin [Micromonospora pallida]